jgi:hypothetical protein
MTSARHRENFAGSTRQSAITALDTNLARVLQISSGLPSGFALGEWSHLALLDASAGSHSLNELLMRRRRSRFPEQRSTKP